MNYAEPATAVAPATAEAAPSINCVNNDPEYKVEPAVETESVTITPAPKVEPAQLYSDARKFAPVDELNEPYKKGVSITPEELKNTGATFAGSAAVSRGVQMGLGRRCCPCLFDPRDFVAYGEASRYIIVKDENVFVFTTETDINPLYNVPLGSLQPVKEDPKKPHKSSVTISPSKSNNLPSDDFETILLVDARGDLAYQFTFDISLDKELGTRFIFAVQNINTDIKTTEKSGK